MAVGREAGRENSTEKETNMQYVTFLAISTLAQQMLRSIRLKLQNGDKQLPFFKVCNKPFPLH
jgi:hypothetical protein